MTHSRKPLTREQIHARWAAIYEGRKAGKSWVEIARSIGMSYDAMRRWCDTVSLVPPKTTRQRRCLTCREMFPSEGPHNQRCTDCRGISLSPYMPDSGGDTGRRVGRAR